MKKILDVPKVKQLEGHCGPASLSMVAQYLGFKLSQKEIAQYWGRDISNGIKYTDLVYCAREFGFIAHPYYNLGLEGIMANIEQGNPIIALVRGSKKWTHFYVIRGFERNPNIVWINDPARPAVNKIPYQNFAKKWRIPGETNQYGIVVRKRD